MKDGFGRNIDTLSISLTNKCNLRCVHCSNDEKVDKNSRHLSIDDYKFIIKNMAQMGIKNIEISAEQSVLDFDLVKLVHYAKNICNIENIQLWTNGIDFYEKAAQLKDAGLDSVSISMNSLKEFRYESITRGGSLSKVFKSFNTAVKLGLDVNVDVLVINGFNEDEIYDFIEIAKNFEVTVRFFELMHVAGCKNIYDDGYIDIEKMMDSIEEVDKFSSDDRACKYYYGNNKFEGIVGIVPMSNQHKCESCNKISVSYDAMMRLCRYSSKEYDLASCLHKPLTFSEFMKDNIVKKPRIYDDIKDDLTDRNFNEL